LVLNALLGPLCPKNQHDLVDSANTPQPIGKKWPNKGKRCIKEISLDLQDQQLKEVF
jgi:hypothetical protein